MLLQRLFFSFHSNVLKPLTNTETTHIIHMKLYTFDPFQNFPVYNWGHRWREEKENVIGIRIFFKEGFTRVHARQPVNIRAHPSRAGWSHIHLFWCVPDHPRAPLNWNLFLSSVSFIYFLNDALRCLSFFSNQKHMAISDMLCS